MRRGLTAAGAAVAAFAALLAVAQPAQAYTVRSGDTLWSIARRSGISVQALAQANGITDPDRIYAGQSLNVSGPAPAAPTAVYVVHQGDSLWSIARSLGLRLDELLGLNRLGNPDFIRPGQRLAVPAPRPVVANLPPGQTAPPTPPISFAAARQILTAAAHRHGLNPAFVLAVADWESGFNQAEVSRDGAVGLMQILPGTAAWAGPSLLGRGVNLRDPYDNADLGAALLRSYLDRFNDPKLALAAYYQGARSVAKDGIYPSSRAYVNGIWALRNRFNAGEI